MSKECRFSDCHAVVSPIHEYCVDHFEWVQIGEVDECPICKKGKFVRNLTCNNCSQDFADFQHEKNTKLAAMQLLSAIENLLTILEPETSSWSADKLRSLKSLGITMDEVREGLQSN